MCLTPSVMYVCGFCLREDLWNLNHSYLKPTQNAKKNFNSGLGLMIWYIRGKYSFGLRLSITDNGIWLSSTWSIKTYVTKLQKGLYSFKGLEKVSPCAFAKILLQISLLPSFLMISVGIMMDNWNKIFLLPVKALLHWFFFFLCCRLSKAADIQNSGVTVNSTCRFC